MRTLILQKRLPLLKNKLQTPYKQSAILLNLRCTLRHPQNNNVNDRLINHFWAIAFAHKDTSQHKINLISHKDKSIIRSLFHSLQATTLIKSSSSISTLHIGQLLIAFQCTQLSHKIRCLHLRIIRFRHRLQQIMQHCSSPTFTQQSFTSYSFIIGAGIISLLTYAVNALQISRTILTKGARVLQRKNKVIIINHIYFDLESYSHCWMSFLLSPANIGKRLLPSILQSNTKGLSTMIWLIMVRVPQVGPSIIGYMLLLLFASSDRTKSATTATVARVYLKIVPNNPGFSLESKMLLQEQLIVLIILLSDMSGILTQPGNYFSLTFQRCQFIMRLQCVCLYLGRGMELKKTMLLPTSNELLNCLLGCLSWSLNKTQPLLSMFFKYSFHFWMGNGRMSLSICEYIWYLRQNERRAAELAPKSRRRSISQLFMCEFYLLFVLTQNNKIILAPIRQLKYLVGYNMGNIMALQDHTELILDFNLALLISCKIAATYLLVKLTRYLNYIQRFPIITSAEAIKQQNTPLLVKTKSVLSKQEATAQIQIPLRNIKDYEAQIKQQAQLIESILRSKQLNAKEMDLYYYAFRSFKRQASLNRFSLFRLVFADCNLPKMYPFAKSYGSASCASSMFLSHSMVSLCRVSSKGVINPLYTGFSRQFIKKIISRQRQIIIVELFVCWGMLLLHADQISKFYRWIRKKSIQLYTKLLEKRRRRIEIHKDEACIICYVRPRNVIFRECRHFIMCDDCLNDPENKMMGCPFCRREGNPKNMRVRFQA